MIVGAVMMAYVLFGGMIATTWVQIVKAVLLLGGAFLLAMLVLARFCVQPAGALRERGRSLTAPQVLGPGQLVADPLDAISLGLALMFGTAGLPHILMRFYTVPDAKTARTSVIYATAFIGFFYLLTFILGFGAMVLVGHEAIQAVDKGGNMAAPLLAEVVGGDGLPRLHRGRRVRHDPRRRRRPHALRRGRALARPVGERGARGPRARSRAARGGARRDACWAPSRSVALGIVFKGQNVAYMVGLAFAIAASANFPALVLSMFWRPSRRAARRPA